MALIYFIQPDESHLWENAGDRAPLGLLALSAWVKQLGHKARVWDLNHDDYREMCSFMETEKPDYVCVTVSTPNYKKAIEFVYDLRAFYPEGKYVGGGNHITDNPNEMKSCKAFHYMLLGEGETAIKRLLDKDYNENIKFTTGNNENLARMITGTVGDVNDYPMPDYEEVDMSRYNMLLDKQKCASIVASRGCIFNCGFCGSSKLKNWRPRDINKVIEEMKYLKDKHEFYTFYFGDDIFTRDRERTIKLCERINEVFGYTVKWRATTRADLVDKELLEVMYNAGCRVISLGCESGSAKVLKVIRKGMTTQQNLQATKWANEVGIKTKGFFICGLPGSSWEEELKTIEFAKELKRNGMDYADYYVYTPYAGTPIWEHPEWFGGFEVIKPKNSDWSNYYQVNKDGLPKEIKFNHPELTHDQIRELVDKFKKEVTDVGLTY